MNPVITAILFLLENSKKSPNPSVASKASELSAEILALVQDELPPAQVSYVDVEALLEPPVSDNIDGGEKKTTEED